MSLAFSYVLGYMFTSKLLKVEENKLLLFLYAAEGGRILSSSSPSVRPYVRTSVRPYVRPYVRPSVRTSILVNATPPKVLIGSSPNLVNIIIIMGRCA